MLRSAVTDAAAAGYNAVGMSGGEPLLYGSLRDLLGHARAQGMVTTVTSNGMLLDARRLAMLEGVTSLLAISLDGVPESHDRMRNSDRAFATMQRRLDGVRASGIPFGFIFTLTQYNLHELDWVASFALERGAALLQVHPLEDVGRAARLLPGARPDDVEARFAWLEVRRLQEEMSGRLRIQLDFAPRTMLRQAPERVYAETPPTEDRPLAEMVSPLVIEPDGEVVPLEYGFGRRFSLGNLFRGSLPELAKGWQREREPAFRELCRKVHAEATADDAPSLVNWYELIHERAGGSESDTPRTAVV
jgi:MoaA/NifB/PqqE/SkfB family radical SAM enzyme